MGLRQHNQETDRRVVRGFVTRYVRTQRASEVLLAISFAIYLSG